MSLQQTDLRPEATKTTRRWAAGLAWSMASAFLVVPCSVYLATRGAPIEHVATGGVGVEQGTPRDHLDRDAQVASERRLMELRNELETLAWQVERMEAELAKAERRLQEYRVASIEPPQGQPRAQRRFDVEENRLRRQVLAVEGLYRELRERQAHARRALDAAARPVIVLEPAG